MDTPKDVFPRSFLSCAYEIMIQLSELRHMDLNFLLDRKILTNIRLKITVMDALCDSQKNETYASCSELYKSSS